ncbi:MAG: cell wall-binding repeat-containing protein, partial [Chloroflexi bacterium]|nr:cell wall-binding repeat-containing protein [Chloroflexota bacterium]
MRRFTLSALVVGVGLLGLVPAAPAEVRVSPNYRLDSDPNPYRGRDQAALAVNPANRQHVVSVNADYLDLECEASRSLDGGVTWSEAVPLITPESIISPYLRSCRTNQSVEFGSGQNVYTTAPASTATNGISNQSSTLVYKSEDGGLTWKPGVVAMQGGTAAQPGPQYFNPRLAVAPGGGDEGKDRIYVTALQFVNQTLGTPACVPAVGQTGCADARVVVSKDSGATFSVGVNANPTGVRVTDSPSKPAINSDGSVTLLWRTVGTDGLIQASRSTDGGVTWSPTPIDVAKVKNTGNAGTTHTVVGSPSSSATFPRVERDPVSGNLYLVYNQGSGGPTEPTGGFQGADHFISFDSAVYFQRSTDGGLKWSTPQRINPPTLFPGTQILQTRHPTVSVSPNGRVNIVWHDRRHWYQESGERTCTHSHIFCEDIRLGDTYYSYSTNATTASAADITFSPNIRINDRSHNNDIGYDARPASGYWSWGPQSVTIGGDKLLIAWMDSREGNWDNENEDIYLAKVDFDASGPVPRTHIDAPDVVSRAVALGKLGYQGGSEGALVGYLRDPAYVGLPACSGSPATFECAAFGVASRRVSKVVIVNENDLAGVIAAQVLGRANSAPVLLSPAAGLPAAVKAEVARMRPEGAFIIGGTGQLADQVRIDLEATGIAAANVQRVEGASDAATAAAIATRMDQRLQVDLDANRPAFDAVVIANPASPDAAVAAGLAAARRLPFLYVTADAIPSSTSDALAALDIDKTLVIGDTNDVSSAVETALPGTATRLGGADVYATSKAVVAESKARGLPSNVVYVADGTKSMDTALLGGVVGRATGILMVAPAPLYETAATQATENSLTAITRFFAVGPPPPAPVVTPPAPPPAAVT